MNATTLPKAERLRLKIYQWAIREHPELMEPLLLNSGVSFPKETYPYDFGVEREDAELS